MNFNHHKMAATVANGNAEWDSYPMPQASEKQIALCEQAFDSGITYSCMCKSHQVGYFTDAAGNKQLYLA